MLEREDDLVLTDYGWAQQSDRMPHRQDMFWLKLPERVVYFFDGDGWYRVDGKESQLFYPIKGNLKHG